MSSAIQETSDSEFEQLIKEGSTLVDFFAEWCGPCKTLTPALEELAVEFSGKVVFAKIDIDKNHVIAQSAHVTSVPTLILYQDGKEKSRLVGLRDADAIRDFISSV